MARNRAKETDVKVVKCEELHVDAGWDVYSFLKLTTDSGLIGWSEYNESRGRRGLTNLVHSFAESLIGKDPRNLNRIEADLNASGRSTSGGLQAHAIAAVVNACIDLAAKSLGVPVYQLLGGKVRDRMPVYWSRCGVVRARNAALFDGKLINSPAVRSLKDLTAAAREAKERGFRALKTNLLLFDENGGRMHQPGSTRGTGHPELNVEKHLVKAFVAQLEALREGAGPDVDLMVDLNFNYKPEGFRRFAKAAEPFDLMWLEMDITDPNALAGIRQSTSTPIASLEAVLGKRPLKAYLEAYCADVAIIDVQYNGILESMRMANMCDAYEINVASHCYNGPLSMMMSAHYCAAIPNFRIMECDVDEVPWRSQLLTNPYRIENGDFVLSDAPGWGADIVEEVVRAHPPKR